MELRKRALPQSLFLFLIAFIAFAITGCGGDAGAQNGQVEGFVVDSEDNSPVANVLVLAEKGTGDTTITRQTLTDGTGHYIITDVPPGVWTVGFQKLGYTTVTNNAVSQIPQEGEAAAVNAPSLPSNSQPTANVFAAVIENGETVTLPAAQMYNNHTLDRYTIRADVRDEVLGTAVDNFTVVVNGRHRKTFTNAQFKSTGFTGLAPTSEGKFTIQIEHESYVTKKWTDADGNTSFSAQGNSIINLGNFPLDPLRVDIRGSIDPEGFVHSVTDSGWVQAADMLPENFPVIVRWDGRVLSRNADAGGATANVAYVQNSTEFVVTGIPVTAQTVTVRVDGKGYVKPGNEVTVSLASAIQNGATLDTVRQNPTVLISTPIPLTAIRKSVTVGVADTLQANSRIQINARGVNSTTQQTVTNTGYVEDVLTNIPTYWPIVFTAVDLSGTMTAKEKTVHISESETNPYVLIN